MTTQTHSLLPHSQNTLGSTVAACLRRASRRLAACTENPQLEAGLLLADVLDCDRTGLFAHPEQHLASSQAERFENLVERRSEGEPLPYLIGQAEFLDHSFAVDEHVLIPRPETEMLVELALKDLAAMRSAASPTYGSPRVVDVGTGSGCIAISLALHVPDIQIFAVDISPDALLVAQKNALRHGVAPKITFFCSDLLDAVPQPVDLIIANPPYIARSEWADLPREVRLHEPRLALDGGADGLRVVARLLEQARLWLRSGGSLLIEIGATQGRDAQLLARHVFPNAHIALLTDLAGRDRVLRINSNRRLGQIRECSAK